MVILLRLLRTTFQNILRHGLLSLAGVLVITLLVLIMNGLIFAGLTERAALRLVNERLDLALNFTSEVNATEISALTQELQQKFPVVRKIQFISSETAFQNFLRSFEENNSALATWLAANSTTSPLPSSLVISADATLHAPLLAYLTSHRLGYALNLDNPATGTLATATTTKILAFEKTLNRLSVFTAVAFSLLAALIIVAVLRLTLVTRQMEITIMRLVGATREFIRVPFLLEGVILSVTASILGTTLFALALARVDLTLLTSNLYGSLGDFLKSASQNYLTDFWIFLGWQILFASAIGLLASYLATRKYLGRELVLS